jgi:hypothetical protein
MEKKIKSLDVNGKIELTVFRGNKLKNFLLRFAWYILENYKLEKIDNPTDLQKSIFESWLNTNW